eukprot:g42870.t1
MKELASDRVEDINQVPPTIFIALRKITPAYVVFFHSDFGIRARYASKGATVAQWIALPPYSAKEQVPFHPQATVCVEFAHFPTFVWASSHSPEMCWLGGLAMGNAGLQDMDVGLEHIRRGFADRKLKPNDLSMPFHSFSTGYYRPLK